MSEAEYEQILKTGKFEAGPNSLEGKFFDETAEDATKWGDALEGAGNYRVLEAKVPKDAAEKMTRWERLDGIGPARYGEVPDLDGTIIKLFGGK